MENEQSTGLKKFQDRTLELAGGDKEKAELANKLAELELDFEFVKDLNTQLANKYQELMDCFPTADEIEALLDELKSSARAFKDDEQAIKRLEERITKLSKFKSALVALEKQDHSAKPVRYDELFNNEKA